MSSFQLEINPDPTAMIQRAAVLWRQWCQEAVTDHGRFTVALSGGSTPKQLYSYLAQQPNLDWEHTLLFWGDERYVPHDHPDSNYRMTRESLLDHIPIPAGNLYPWPTATDPDQDARTYQQLLQQVFQTEWPAFDLMLLGIGGDGHTASLFPGTPALQVEDEWTTVGNKDGEPRLTLTFPAINHSRQVMFLVSGSGKAEILKALLTNPSPLPAQQVKAAGQLLWFLDRDAAAQLPLYFTL